MNSLFDRRGVLGFFCTAVILSVLCAFAFSESRQWIYSSPSLAVFGSALAIAGTMTFAYLFYQVNLRLRLKSQEETQLKEAISATRESLEAKVAYRDGKLQETDYIYSKLEETDYMYRSLAANIPGSAITILDREERYLLAEGDLLEKMGYTKNNMPGKKIAEVITPENYGYYQGLIRKAFAGESTLVERQTLSGYYTLMKVVPLRKEDDFIFAIMFVLLDVTPVKKVQFELQKLNDELEAKVSTRTEQLKELNKELESFAYSVSHDLRAPLRGITGYAQILMEDYAPLLGEEGKHASDVIIANALRMGKLIDDLLEFSRLGRKEITRSQVNMDELVKEILGELMPAEGPRKLNIRQLPLDPVKGDGDMLRQVWINLISNALKYSRKKEIGEIEIGSRRENGDICYTIKDNGAGFDMQYVDKLFGVFQRLHKVKDFEGTGVGLALVKTIIKKHGGRIWADAKVDEGATFYFTIPANN